MSRIIERAAFLLIAAVLFVPVLLLGLLSQKKKHDTSFYFFRALAFPPILFVVSPLLLLIFPWLLPDGYATFGVLLYYAIYALLLLALLPLLRRRLTAETCAFLWITPAAVFGAMPFTLLSGGGGIFSNMFRPFVYLRVNGLPFWLLLGIWAAGFAFAFGWRILSHLRFRRLLLKDASEAPTPVLSAFMKQRYVLSPGDDVDPAFPDRWQVVWSPAAKTPTSIGLFKSTVRIVLPKRYYTEEELELILRHELIHLQQRDNLIKFFLSFLVAVGWFLPPLWLGLGRCGEDLELRCDELATEKLSDAQRKEYARLLLSQGGTAQGFTTCLSASAGGLRYRLKRIVHPEQRHRGGWLVLLLFLLFSMTANAVAVAPKVGTVKSLVFNGNPAAFVESVRMEGDTRRLTAEEEKVLLAALDKVELYEMIGSETSRQELGPYVLRISMETTGEGAYPFTLTFYEKAVVVHSDAGLTANSVGVLDPARFDLHHRGTDGIYLYGTPPDWDLLRSLAQAPAE